MSVHPDQPQTIGGVLDTTFRLYKASLVALIPLSLLMALANSGPSIYMIFHLKAGVPATQVQTLQSAGYWVTQVASLLCLFWILAALYIKTQSIGTGEGLSIASALKRGLVRL